MMLIKNVSFFEAAHYSAWPKRLIGLSPWQKKERTSEEILIEYNDFWYKKALTLWEKFTKATQNIRPTRFFRMLENVIRDEIIQNYDVYGVSKDEHLISINQDLFVANWSIVSTLYDNLLADVIEKYINQYKISTLVELGCGNGCNLFKLYERLMIDGIIGGEICSNAIELSNQIVEHCKLPGSFHSFDYTQEGSIAKLVKDLDKKYLLFTSHSIEQIQLKKTNFVEQVLRLDHKPEMVIHFEPIVDKEDGSLASQLHLTYSERNLYNSDLLDVLRTYEKNGDIEIIEFKRNVFGASAFNPTSVLAWKCL